MADTPVAINMGKTLTGTNNILIGLRAGQYITTGSYNIGIGPDALADITTESHVIEIGGVRVVDPQLAEELVPVLREFIDTQLGRTHG